MTPVRIGNIPLKKFRKFLVLQDCKVIKTTKGRGGHEKWSKSSLERPITLQTHIDPVPAFIVSQVLRHLGLSRKEFDKHIAKC